VYPKSQLHTRFEGYVVKEIRDILECVGGVMRGYHQFVESGLPDMDLSFVPQ
jgi:hypothetical protein